MILTGKIKVKVSKKNIEHFINIGIDVKLKEIIEIDPIQLNKGSHFIIDVKCDVCDKERKLDFQSYKDNIDKCNFYACSSKCAQEKVKKKNFEKFGVDYYMQTQEYKERVNKTSLDKYGCEHYTQNEEVKNRHKKTCLEKYGFENSFQNEEVKNRHKKNCFTKYGVENPFQSEIIKEKIKQTNLEKYGFEYRLQNEEEKNKLKKLMLETYGVECYLSLDENKNKSKNAHLEKYGIPFGQKNKEIIEKINTIKKQKWIKKILQQNSNIKLIEILSDKKIYIFECENGHNFEITFGLTILRNSGKTILCTICNPIEKHISGLEIQLSNFIKEHYKQEIIENSKKIITPLEIDVYLPDLKLAFEFNGLFWHSEIQRENNYHYNKTELCEKQGIQLIHIYEDDWMHKQNIVKSRILNLLGKTSDKIYGRRCEIKEITDNDLIRKFLNENHIQGFVGSQVKLGLFYNNELVSLMIFGKLRKPMGSISDENVYEMLRFCNKLNTTVIGGADKLFKYFIKTYSPVEVISYADRSWSQGSLYKKLGFTFIHKTPSNYYYIIDKIYRKHRFNYRKDILVKQGFDFTKTEHEIMLERKLYRIYDSGSLKFSWKPTHY